MKIQPGRKKGNRKKKQHTWKSPALHPQNSKRDVLTQLASPLAHDKTATQGFAKTGYCYIKELGSKMKHKSRNSTWARDSQLGPRLEHVTPRNGHSEIGQSSLGSRAGGAKGLKPGTMIKRGCRPNFQKPGKKARQPSVDKQTAHPRDPKTYMEIATCVKGAD